METSPTPPAVPRNGNVPTDGYEGAEKSIEEFVRQWALRQLLTAYKYPTEWIGERIVIEEPVKMGSTEKSGHLDKELQ